MNKTTCWWCKEEFEYDGEKYREVICPNCRSLNDVFNPALSEPKQEEEKMIEDIKLPFVKGEDLKAGDIATIKSEFKRTGQYQKYTANCELNSQLVQLTLNDTSISILVSHWGNDPTKWIDKEIILSFEDTKTKENVRIWRPKN